MSAMRRLCLILVAASLAVPVAALARSDAAGDGSLGVSNASGSLTLSGKGLIFGHIERGTLTVRSYRPDGTAVPTVSGAKMRLVGNAINVVYSGSDVRFLFPGGKYTIQIEGTDIDISAVGRGNVSAVGAGTYDDGTLVTDDGTPLNLGRFALAASWGGASSAGSGSDSGKVTTSSSSDSGKPAGYSDSGKTTGSGRG